MSTIRYIIILLAICLLGVYADPGAQRYEPTWDSLDKRVTPTWYDEAKLGIFIHWGLFSVPSFDNEWFWWNWAHNDTKYINFMAKNYRPGFTYGDFANQFTAEWYDPDKWAEIFKASGAKYIALTSKHHEGYTLWPSTTSFNWNAMDVGPKRDLLGDLAVAVRKQGIKFGAYHSLMDWYHPLFLSDEKSGWKDTDFVKAKSRPELEELVNKYKPELIWSDGDWTAPATYWNSTDIIAWLYNDSPVKDTIVVNDRWGKDMICHHGDFYTCSDRYAPSVLQPHKWESCMSFDKKSWGFRREAPLADYMTTEEVVHSFVQTISCGGNLLLNIGPTHDGRIPLLFEERLRQLGAWLGINGEAVYATKPWVNHRTHQNDSVSGDVWYTYKDKNVYPIALSWPKNNQLELGDIDFKTVNTVELLGTTGQLAVKEKGKGVVITFPPLTPPIKLDYAYALRIKTK